MKVKDDEGREWDACTVALVASWRSLELIFPMAATAPASGPSAPRKDERGIISRSTLYLCKSKLHRKRSENLKPKLAWRPACAHACTDL
jgi:hypothetical protein